MTDIAERLRQMPVSIPLAETEHINIGDEAADEIERLRALLAATERDLERALAALDHHLKVDR
jgi:hypothetical protein